MAIEKGITECISTDTSGVTLYYHNHFSLRKKATIHQVNKCNQNIIINVSVYSLKSPLSSADFTIYTPGIGTLSIYTLISSGENSVFAHFAVAIANHYNLAFSFHQVPITAGSTEAV